MRRRSSVSRRHQIEKNRVSGGAIASGSRFPHDLFSWQEQGVIVKAARLFPSSLDKLGDCTVLCDNTTEGQATLLLLLPLPIPQGTFVSLQDKLSRGRCNSQAGSCRKGQP